MTKSELIRAARARGATVAPHVVEYLAQVGKLDPTPRLDGSHRRVYEPAHIEQVLEHVRRPAASERATAKAG